MPLYLVYEITGTQPAASTTDRNEAKKVMAELLDDAWKAECIARESDGSIRDITADMTEDAATLFWLDDYHDEYDLPGWVVEPAAFDDWQRQRQHAEYEHDRDLEHQAALRANL